MLKDLELPGTLEEALRKFADADYCFEVVKALRWPDGIIPCSDCGCTEHGFVSTRRLFRCKACKREFSVKVGTIFEDSPLALGKWLGALWLIANAKNGISSWELHRALGVTQKTAWFMNHRIREAMASGTFVKLSGTVEIDESYIGGKNRNRHKDKKVPTGFGGKAIVMGFLERGGNAHALVASDVTRRTLHGQVTDTVERGSKVYTDSLPSYNRLRHDYLHETVNHLEEYVRGEVHTNGLENFWSLFKRALKGTYVSVDPFHLNGYVVEQTFRFNERKDNDGGRFRKVLASVTGKRVTYKELTSNGATAAA